MDDRNNPNLVGVSLEVMMHHYAQHESGGCPPGETCQACEHDRTVITTCVTCGTPLFVIHRTHRSCGCFESPNSRWRPVQCGVEP